MFVVKTDKNAQSEEVTTREVENVLVILRETYKANNRSPICYFEFVTNPVSFSQTIENVFYTSFLIRVRRFHYYGHPLLLVFIYFLGSEISEVNPCSTVAIWWYLIMLVSIPQKF